MYSYRLIFANLDLVERGSAIGGHPIRDLRVMFSILAKGSDRLATGGLQHAAVDHKLGDT